MKCAGVTLPVALDAFEQIAPLRFAEPWDNVGLLVEPRRPRRIRRVLLTIDLTAVVFAEALQRRADLIVAYHPPLFPPLKALRPKLPAQRILLKALARSVAVYSPHTALDAITGGVNDWLADAFGPGERAVILPHPEGKGLAGQGRRLVLDSPRTLAALATALKKHLGIRQLRMAHAPNGPSRIRTVALCAGAGGSVLAGVNADLHVTGEMKHHDILSATGRGSHVILCEHTHSERGFLAMYRRRLKKIFGPAVDVCVARTDREPVCPF